MADRPQARRPDSMAASGQAAEQLAIAALGFIAAEPERLGRFLALTGIGPDSIRAAAREPQFLAGVLDHLGRRTSRCCSPSPTRHAIDPDAVMRARAALTGDSPLGMP